MIIGHPLGYAKRISFARDEYGMDMTRVNDQGCYCHNAPVFFGNNGSLVLTIPLRHKTNKGDDDIYDGRYAEDQVKVSWFLAGVHVQEDKEHYDREVSVELEEERNRSMVYTL
jgi:hypothetical protein